MTVTTTTTTDPDLDEIRDRLRRVAPGVRDGNPEAIAEFEQLEMLVAGEQRRRKINQLAADQDAEIEAAVRRAAIEAERHEWTADKAELEELRDAELVKFERALEALCTAGTTALALDAEARRLDHLVRRIDDPEARYLSGRLQYGMENRIIYLLRGARITGLGGVLGPRDGRTPLAVRECVVCKHPQRAEIEARAEAGEPLRALETDYGVSRSVLSRHAKRHR